MLSAYMFSSNVVDYCTLLAVALGFSQCVDIDSSILEHNLSVQMWEIHDHQSISGIQP